MNQKQNSSSDNDVILDEIRRELTPYDVYGSELTKTARGFKCRCPLHTEKTASFHIRQDLSFHCFGCNESGSVFTFIMKRDNCDFPTALKTAAELARVDLPTQKEAGKYAKLYSINTAAKDFFHQSLMNNEKALSYLTGERKLTMDTIKRFKIGYAEGASAVAHLKSKGFTEAEILSAGIAKKKDGKVMDFFYKRLIFPITFLGKTRGFGGRAFGDVGKEVPKFLNTQETPIFKKRRSLYGFDANAIREKGFAIVVEGYFDVDILHQYGHTNTVAPLGTALTEEHIEYLRQYCKYIVLVYDGDKAGARESQRTAQLCFEKWMPGYVVVMPEGKDPDEFLIEGGDFSERIDRAMPFPAFLSKYFPAVRKWLCNQLLERSSWEIAEFLAYAGTPEEVKAFRHLNAMSYLEHSTEKSFVVAKDNSIEVRMQGNSLVLYSKGRFLLWEEITGSDIGAIGQQASEMMQNVLRLNRIRADYKKATQPLPSAKARVKEAA